jgi:type II secretory pathway pseudopilin PulG
LNEQTRDATEPDQPAPVPPSPPTAAAAPKKGGWWKWVALGCGCLLIVGLIVGLILAAIAIPAFMRAKSASQDAEAAVRLRNGVTAAATYYTDKSSYEGMNAAQLGRIDSSARFQDGAPGPDLQQGVIYIDPSSVTKDGYRLIVKSESGSLLRASYSNTSGMKFERSENGVTWTDLVRQ